MKFLALIFACLFVFSTYAVINQPTGTYVNSLGVVEKYDALETTVKNDTGATIAAGSLVKYGATGTAGYNVVLTATDGENAACLVEVAIADGKIGRCKIYGHTSVLLFETADGETAVINEDLYASSVTTGYARPQASGSVTTLYRPIGYALTTCNATGTCEAFINLK